MASRRARLLAANPVVDAAALLFEAHEAGALLALLALLTDWDVPDGSFAAREARSQCVAQWRHGGVEVARQWRGSAAFVALAWQWRGGGVAQ